MPLAPVNAPSDVLRSAQLEHRQYFHPLTLPTGAQHKMPGAPYHLSATPWQSTGRAPRFGEHTDEILAEAGFSANQIGGLRDTGVVR